MPLITVTYSSSRAMPSLKADIAAAVTELTATILHKDPKVTAIIVKSVDAADWFAGGGSLASIDPITHWIESRITSKDCSSGHHTTITRGCAYLTKSST